MINNAGGKFISAEVKEETLDWEKEQKEFYYLEYDGELASADDDDVIRVARENKSRTDYNVWYNSCETFATHCKTGKQDGLNAQADAILSAAGLALAGSLEAIRSLRNPPASALNAITAHATTAIKTIALFRGLRTDNDLRERAVAAVNRTVDAIVRFCTLRRGAAEAPPANEKVAAGKDGDVKPEEDTTAFEKVKRLCNRIKDTVQSIRGAGDVVGEDDESKLRNPKRKLDDRSDAEEDGAPSSKRVNAVESS